MGKKSLTKSTTKKKSKKTKKPADAPAASAASKKKQTASAASNLTPPLDRQFDEWAPKKPWKPKPDKSYDKDFAATPVVKGKSKEANRIRKLLIAPVDLEAPAPEKKEKPQKTAKTDTKKQQKPETKNTGQAKAKPAPKKKPSAKELIAYRFDTWQPEKPFAPENAEAVNFTAPPAFDGVDRSIVLKTFDLSVPDEPKAEKPPETEPIAPEATPGAPEETTAETEATEPDPKKEPVPIEQLLKRHFDWWQPEKPFVPETPDAKSAGTFNAPAAFEGVDRAIIVKQFDLSIPDAPKTEKPTAPEKPAAETAEETPAPAAAGKTAEAPTPAIEEPVEKAAEPKPPEPETNEEEAVKAPEAEAEKPPETEAPEPPPEPKPETVTEPEATAATEQTPEIKPEVSEPVQKETAEKKKEAAKEAKAPPAVSAQAPPPEEPPANDAKGGGDGDGGDGRDDVPPGPPGPPREPLLGRGAKMLVAILGVIFLILIATSIANNQQYTLKDTRDGVEIWRGDFSPAGKNKIAFLPGATIPEDMEEATNRKDVMRLAYNHYMGQVDQLMDDKDIQVDLGAIRENLEKANQFAFTAEKKQAVKKRLRQVDFAMLIYRTDVAMSEDTREGYERALEYLGRASELDIESGARIEVLESKTNLVKSRLEEFMPEEPEDKALEDEPLEDEKPEDAETEDAEPEEETETGEAREDTI